MARVPKMARGVHRCPKYCLFLLPHPRLYTVHNMCMYTHTGCVWSTAKHLYTDRSGAKCWLDIYRWGAGLAVNGPIAGIGHSVLLSAFEQEVAAASYCHVWLLIAFLEGGLYCRHNTVIVLQTDYVIIIVMRIIDNYGRLLELTLLFRFPMFMRKDSSWFAENLGTRLQKFRQSRYRA